MYSPFQAFLIMAPFKCLHIATRFWLESVRCKHYYCILFCSNEF